MRILTRFFTYLFIKFFLPKHQFEQHDIIKNAHSTEQFMVEGLYYDQKLQPVLIVSDDNGRRYGMLEKLVARG